MVEVFCWAPWISFVFAMDTHPLFLNLASFEHYPEEAHCLAEKDNCIVPRNLWLSWVDNQDEEILLLEIKQNTTTHILVVEGHHDFSRGTIYIPPRYLNDFRTTELAEVRVVTEIPPVATNIKLSILEDEFQGFDIATATSEYLSHWNILSKGTILSVPCPELAGYPVDILVVDIEPANTVLLRGEVSLELEERETQDENRGTQTTPATSRMIMPQSQVSEDFDACIPQPILSQTGAKSYIPFGGTGYTLGS